MEPSGTNLALHSRDLSNVVWVKTSITAAKNAVGADGTVSGATTLTATAASGTVLQALSHASQSRIFSAYIRRVTGTGAIQLTTNGGTNWTTVTITSGYTQVACAAQTVLNGSVGVRMAVSGDVIEVDFTQGEVGSVATSPIPTTTTSATRNADVISLSGAVSGCIGQTEGTIYAEVDFKQSPDNRRVFALSNGTTTSRLGISIALNTFRIVKDASTALLPTAIISNGMHKMAVAYNASEIVFYFDGVPVGTSATSGSGTYFQINVGSTETNTAFYNGPIRAAAIYATKLTNAQLQALTT